MSDTGISIRLRLMAAVWTSLTSALHSSVSMVGMSEEKFSINKVYVQDKKNIFSVSDVGRVYGVVCSD